jgi:hypothetical protein
MVQVHLCIALVPSGHTWVVCVIVQVHLFIALVCSEHTWVGLYVWWSRYNIKQIHKTENKTLEEVEQLTLQGSYLMKLQRGKVYSLFIMTLISLTRIDHDFAFSLYQLIERFTFCQIHMNQLWPSCWESWYWCLCMANCKLSLTELKWSWFEPWKLSLVTLIFWGTLIHLGSMWSGPFWLSQSLA